MSTRPTLDDLDALVQSDPELVIAARWSTDIRSDYRRGRSFVGWALSPRPTEEEAWIEYIETACASLLDYEDEEAYERSFRRVRERLERRGYAPLRSRPDGSWLMAGPGLCAHVAETVEEAIEQALDGADQFRGSGCRLYVFAARAILEDPDAGPGVWFVRPATVPVATNLVAPEV